MKTFKMNTLVGADEKGEDIIIKNETWVELDLKIYLKYFNEVKQDWGKHLITLTRITNLIPLNQDLVIHFCKYDLPVVIVESRKTIEGFFSEHQKTVPGLMADGAQVEEIATCHRNRLSSLVDGISCLFPFIIMPVSPPLDLRDSPLLAHEMVHLRKTLTKSFDEKAIRLTYWNADMQEYCRNNYFTVLEYKMTSLLEEEWEACEANFNREGRQRAFTHIHIPGALSGCGNLLDWWLNDEGRYLNINLASGVITNALKKFLIEVGYNDESEDYPMNPQRWSEVTERVFREAYRMWKKHPGDFKQYMSQSISS